MAYVPGYGSIGAKLMIIAECPTRREGDTGKGFTDNRELDFMLREAGIIKSDCWVTYVCKYFVEPNYGDKKIPFHIRARNTGFDFDTCINELQTEINEVQPNCILALGKTALWALSGKSNIQNFRGSILHGMGRKVVATYNPAHLSWQAKDVEFKGYWNRHIMIMDMKRALLESASSIYELPSRTLEICTTSAQLLEFKKRYAKHRKMSADIEANGTCLPVCIGLACNKHHGIVVPLWNCEGISTIPDSDMVQCWIILQDLLWNKDIIGQNFNYDRDKLKRIGLAVRKVADDVMMKGFALSPEWPKRLAFWTSILTREPFYKDEGMYEGSIKDLLMGCARDACVTYEISEAMDPELNEMGLRSFYQNFLMRLPEFYWGIERQGFAIDTVERDRLLRKYIEWDERIRYELFQLTGTEINVNSPKQISILLFDNFRLPPKAGTGEEEITELLNSQSSIKNPTHRKVCELILEGRRVRKSISTYLMALPDFDGRMRTTYFPCLDTGRSSTGQQDPPIRPTVEVIDENGKRKSKVLGIAYQTMTKHGDIGADIRGMYVPDEWHINEDMRLVYEEEVFLQADSSQAEARVVWLLADDEEALRLVDEIDYHAYTATWFFGENAELFNYDKKKLGYEHPIRFCGKTLRHAGHLGAGKRRAAISVNTDARKYKIPISITEATAEQALRIFHAKQPRIQQVFQAQVIECLKRDRTLVAPLPYGIDAAMGGKRIFFDRMGEELFRAGFSYIPQRAVTDNTKAAGLRIKDRIPLIKIVMESHDALLFSIPISKVKAYATIIKEEFERPIDFSRCSLPRRPLVIPCEIETGKNYRDFVKFKDLPIVAPPKIEPTVRKKTITEEFTVVPLREDTELDKKIYDWQEREKLLRDL